MRNDKGAVLVAASKKRTGAVYAKDFDPNQPRADDGKWTSGGGGGQEGGDKGPSTADPHNDEQYKKSDGKYHVGDDVDAAARLISQEKDVVLDQPREVSSLLDKLADLGKQSASGEKKVYDLCRVSVPGTNLFCSESKGYPRAEMPQLTGKPLPGSPGDKLPKDKFGDIDVTNQFVEDLGKQGYAIERTREDAGYLRATQRELDGVKVAAIMKRIQSGESAGDTALLVSKDNYIIDGHHRWAAMVALSYAAQVKIELPVQRVNIGVVDLVDKSRDYAKVIGIPQRAVGKSMPAHKDDCGCRKSTPCGCGGLAKKDFDPNQARDDDGKWTSGGSSGNEGTGSGGSAREPGAPPAAGVDPERAIVQNRPKPPVEGVGGVREGAAGYNAEHGLDPIREGIYVKVDEPRARSIAAEYDKAPAIDRSPETVAAYAALEREVEDQWRYAEDKMGVTFEAWTKEGQPYNDSKAMRDDVAANKHLYFFTGGEPHPNLGKVGQDGLSANDKFRAVHDLFGHSAEGYGFGERGEENAWLKHSQMFSPAAQRAMTTETRGQNSWVNFGKQNYNEDGSYKNLPREERPYATQKVMLLPEWASDWKGVIPKKGVVFAVLKARTGAVYARDFNESQPRDDHGRWSETGGNDGDGSELLASDFDSGAPFPNAGHNSVAEDSMEKVGQLIDEAGGGAGYEQPSNAKAAVSENLAKALATNPAWQKYQAMYHASDGALMTGGLVNRWAQTSSDTNPRSLLLQAMAAEEFGLTDYRNAGNNSGYVNGLDPLDSNSLADSILSTTTSHAGEQEARDTLKGGYRAFLREMYTQTQADLAENGITSVYVARGVAEEHRLGAGEIMLHPMSSFSTDVSTAQNFAGATAIFAKVPASQVISTPRTGFGCLSEHEVVVLGGTIKAVVLDRHLTADWSNHVAAALRGEKPKRRAAAVNEPIQVDGTLADADWTKTAWDLPPYKSPEFMLLVQDLDLFRTLPVYRHAVASGLIANDEWAGAEPAGKKAAYLRVRFSEDQPRADDGKWTSGGGGGGAAAAEKPSADPPTGVLSQVPERHVLKAEQAFTEAGFPPEVMAKKADSLMEYGRANPEIWTEGMTWYAREHENAQQLAATSTTGMTDDSAAAVLAAVSPRTDLETARDAAGLIVQSVNDGGTITVTPRMIEDQYQYIAKIAAEQGNEGLLQKAGVERARALKEDVGTYDVLTGDPGKVAQWHPNRNAVMTSNWEKGFRIARGELPDDVLSGPKVWSFYDNMRNPEGSNSVTIDSWMVRSLTSMDAPESEIVRLLGASPGGKLTTGRYEVLSRRIRETAQRYGVRPHQAQAIMWLAAGGGAKRPTPL